jgi:hypothetical protein
MGLHFYPGSLKTIIVIISLLFFRCPAFAQGSLTLRGSIMEAGTNKPVGFATVALQDKAQQVLDGAACDVEGNFIISKVAFQK